MRMKIFLLLCFSLPLFAFAQPETALQKLVGTPGLKSAAVGVSVKRVSDGKVLAEYRPATALTPASVTKLIATALALKEKGAGYSYATDVFYSGNIVNGVLEGDIIIQPSGDPCFDSRYFPAYKLTEELALAVAKAGIRKIAGTISIRESGKPEEPVAWLWEDLSNYYAAPYRSFNYRDNSYTLELASGVAGAGTKFLGTEPELPGIVFKNEVAASVKDGDNAWIFGGPYSRTLYLKGTIPQHRTSFKIKGAMYDPAACFVNELAGILKRKGITVGGNTLKGAGSTKLLALRSPALKEIVFHTNKMSVNLFAEALGKLVAEADYQREVRRLLGSVGLDASGIILKDACGLSPLDAVPAGVFTDLLIWACRNQGDDFVRSLPEAGVDGGLNGYYGGNPALKNKLRAKTGTISGVRCLSGYLVTRSGEQLAFTIMINHYTCTVSQLQKAVQSFLLALADR